VVTGPVRVAIGLDLGTHMGHAIVDLDGRRIESGVWHFEHRGREAKQDPGARILRAINMVGSFLAEAQGRYRVAGVLYEMVRRHEGVQAAHVYGGLEWIVLAQCSRLRLNVDIAEVAALKTIATSRGNAAKHDMVLAARRRWGIDADGPHAADEADALFCADMLRRRVTGSVL
jgi:hypothetical protein